MHKTLSYKNAVMLMVLSATIMSTGGLFVRGMEAADQWQILFWRGSSLGIGIFVVLAIQHRAEVFREFISIGKLGLLCGVLLAGALIGYILSMANTTIANAFFTMSAVPFITTILAWLVLGEKVSAITLGAIILAIFGISLMVGDGLASGQAFGNFMALFAAFSAAGFVVALRKGRETNLLPTIAVAAIISAIFALAMQDNVMDIPLNDIVLGIVMGGVVAVIGQYLFVLTSRHLLAGEITLLSLIEFVLGPIWVWLFINEVPSTMTLAGGVIVLSAISANAIHSIVHNKKTSKIL